jgi:iron complex outermembrane receptor protein
MTRKLSIVLAFAASLFQASAQADKNATTPPTLPELAVEAKPVKELNWGGSAPIDGSQVENRGISSISDLSGIAPNFYVNSNGIQSYGDVITMRGIGNTQLFGDPAVILYVDGVPAGSTATYSSTLFDVESVEVLRGFQGHRFGKNAPGGVINVKTRRPGDTHRSKLFASYGTFDTQNYRILADGPMSNSSSYYFGLNRSSSDGFADNLDPLGNDATSESLNGRLGFNWKTEGGLEIGLGGTWEEFDLGAQPIVPRNSGNDKYSGFYSRNSAENERGDIGSNSQYLKLSKPTKFGRVTSTTSRNDWELSPNFLDLTFVDEILANADIAAFGFVNSTSEIHEHREQIAEELVFESDNDSDSSWALGLYLNFSEVDGKATRTFPDPRGWQDTQTTNYDQESNSYALFGNTIKPLGENTRLELGLRLDHSDKTQTRSKRVVGQTTTTTNHDWTISANKQEDYMWFSPKVGISHELTDNAEIFASSSFSGKPGGFSPWVDDQNFTAQLGISSSSFDKERIWANEIGGVLKGESGNWNLGLTFFWNEASDYQFEKPSGYLDYYVDNAEEASMHGIDVDFSATPMEGWLLNLNFGMTDGEIEKHKGLSFDQTLPTFSSEHDFAGKDIPFTPEHTLSASLSHQLTDSLGWSVGVRHVGETHYLDQTATDTANDSYTLLDASIGYDWRGWGINVFGTNLTDEEYYSSLVSNLTGSPGIVGSPRVIGLSISKEF